MAIRMIPLLTFAALLVFNSPGWTQEQQHIGIADNPHAFDPNRACGAYCLAFLNTMFGGSEPYGEVARLCPPGPQGVNLLEIQEAAVSLGLHVKGIRATLDQLADLPYPAILHLNQENGLDHFVVWIRWDGSQNTAYVFSPPATLKHLRLTDLKKYSGVALLVSKNPIPEKLFANSDSGNLRLWLLAASFAAMIALVLWHISSYAFRVKRSSVVAQGIALLLMASILTGCQNATQTGDSNVDEIRQVDLGEVQPGKDLEHTFAIRNSTQKPVTLTHIEKSCTCQLTELRVGAVIRPGEVLKVPYVVPLKGLKGPQSGRLILTTDSEDENLKVISLFLKGEVPNRLKAVPPQVVFGVVPPSGIGERTLRVESVVPGLIEKFHRTTVLRGFAKVRLISTTSSTLVFGVSVSLDAPIGDVSDVVTVHFDDNTYPALTVEIRALKVGPLEVVPKSLSLAQFVSDDPQVRKIRLRSTENKPFKIRHIECGSGITVEGIPEMPVVRCDLTIKFTRPEQDVEFQKIKISTDLDDVVEVTARFPRHVALKLGGSE